MDEQKPESGAVGTAAATAGQISQFFPERVTVTTEDTYSGHVIRDDQLSQLERGAVDQSLGWAQCLLGGGIGLFQNVISLLKALNAGKIPEVQDAILALGCAACLASAGALLYVNRNKSSDIKTLCNSIRNRTRTLR
jgi:hypothetical protein